MPLLQALPTPQTILVVGSDCELSHVVSNYKSRRLSIQVSELERDVKVVRGQSEDFLSLLKITKNLPILVTMVYILSNSLKS